MSENPKLIRWHQRMQNLEKAFGQLQEAVGRIEQLDDLGKEGLIQRFEYTFELYWKTLKDYLESQNVDAEFPREVIKKAFKAELIDDGELWLEMLEKRNVLSNTYDQDNLMLALELIVPRYCQQIQRLIEILNQKLKFVYPQETLLVV